MLARICIGALGVLTLACAGATPADLPNGYVGSAAAAEPLVRLEPSLEEPSPAEESSAEGSSAEEPSHDASARPEAVSERRAELDLDGDGRPELIVLREQSISIGPHTLPVPDSLLRDAFDLDMTVVNIDRHDGRRELMLSEYADEGVRRYYFFSYEASGVVASDPIVAHRPTITGNGRVRFRHQNCGRTRTHTYRLRRRTLRYRGERVRGRFKPEACVACPYVYIEHHGSWLRVGEILRHLDSAAVQTWQSLRLPLPPTQAATRIVVRIAEEKAEVTYLNALRLDTGVGAPTSPTICATAPNDAVCAIDDDFVLLEQGQVREFTFTVPAGASRLTVLAHGYYLAVQ